MAAAVLSKVIGHLRNVLGMQDAAGLTDGDLLKRYLHHRDEAAFEALLRRHGPMVMGVSRRVLCNPHDAEDAFQATFLVLLRKASSLRSHDTVGNWLYGVAYRTAKEARRAILKRKAKEAKIVPNPEAPADAWNDLREALDLELERLPEKYRTVIVLSDLEGVTGKEVALLLGVPEGTVASRLARGRAMLAKRLARPGLAVSGGSLAAVLSQNGASAGLPTSVVSSTIKAASLFTAGKGAMISANVAALTEGVLKTMLLTKLKTVTVVLVMLSMVTLTTAMLAWGQAGDKGNSVEPAARAEKQPDEPKDPPKNFTNSIGMKFVWIPAGSFMMGSTKEEKRREKDETQHKITLTKGFYMAVYAVTQEEWHAVMGNNPSNFKGEKNLPVEQVTWNDCQEFCKKLRQKENKLYRLPTEAEWEFACRAGTTTPFYFGDTISTDQANYFGEEVYGNGKAGVYRGKTTPIGSFPANAWGLYDMHGNVWQWCLDWYGDYPEKGVLDPQGPNAGNSRVLRGGSWNIVPGFCRSAYRNRNEPGNRSFNFGLRLCFFVE